MKSHSAGIAGVGHALPQRVVDNSAIAEQIGRTPEWIARRTGIRTRHWLAEGECLADICAKAARRALQDASLAARDVDLILLATVSAEQSFPSVACRVQEQLGCERAVAFDLSAACSGFVFALSTAEAFVLSGKYRNILVIGGESLARLTNQKDPGSAHLFGDGAGAVLLRPWEECRQGRLEATGMGSDGAGGSRIEMREKIYLDGKAVYRFSVPKMTEVIHEAMNGYDSDNLGLLIPHQANRRLIESVGGFHPHCSVTGEGRGETQVRANLGDAGNGCRMDLGLVEKPLREGSTAGRNQG